MDLLPGWGCGNSRGVSARAVEGGRWSPGRGHGAASRSTSIGRRRVVADPDEGFAENGHRAGLVHGGMSSMRSSWPFTAGPRRAGYAMVRTVVRPPERCDSPGNRAGAPHRRGARRSRRPPDANHPRACHRWLMRHGSPARSTSEGPAHTTKLAPSRRRGPTPLFACRARWKPHWRRRSGSIQRQSRCRYRRSRRPSAHRYRRRRRHRRWPQRWCRWRRPIRRCHPRHRS